MVVVARAVVAREAVEMAGVELSVEALVGWLALADPLAWAAGLGVVVAMVVGMAEVGMVEGMAAHSTRTFVNIGPGYST